jgi:hypothetical protein
VPDVTALFAPPEEIQAILARPFADWSNEDYARVVAWLHDAPRRAYLSQIAARVSRASGSTGTDDADAIVEAFYRTRVDRLLRRARFKNVGALLLVEFDTFLRTSLQRAASVSKPVPRRARGAGVEASVPPTRVILLESSGPPPTRPARKLSTRDRLLLAWPSHEPPSTEQEKQEQGQGEWVETTVFGPRKVPQGRQFLLQAFAHRPDQAAEAQRLAIEFDTEATARLGIRTLGIRVVAGTRLTFSLALPGLSIIEPIQDMVWQGRTEGVAFGVEVTPDHPVGNVIGTVTVTADSIPVGRITIKIEITAAGNTPSPKMDALNKVTTDARHYELAFISYASPDRNTVLRMVQMLRVQGIRFFQDVLDLEPGDRWAHELYRHIDECDLFLLFWSSHAKASAWVRKEVAHALQRKAGDDDAPPTIHPVIIEGPPAVPPPSELAHLQFNDKLIYFMTPSD